MVNFSLTVPLLHWYNDKTQKESLSRRVAVDNTVFKEKLYDSVDLNITYLLLTVLYHFLRCVTELLFILLDSWDFQYIQYTTIYWLVE